MSGEFMRTVTACCWHGSANMKINFDPTPLLDELKMRTEKGFAKKDVGVQWLDEPGGAQLLIRVLTVDQGNQFLRYMFPFLSPAVMEAEVRIAVEGGYPDTFKVSHKAQMGLFGGSPKGMLKVCAQMIAKKVVKQSLKRM